MMKPEAISRATPRPIPRPATAAMPGLGVAVTVAVVTAVVLEPEVTSDRVGTVTAYLVPQHVRLLWPQQKVPSVQGVISTGPLMFPPDCGFGLLVSHLPAFGPVRLWRRRKLQHAGRRENSAEKERKLFLPTDRCTL